MAFGLKNAAAFFNLWVRQLYDKLPMSLKQYIVIYLDDVLIHTPELEQHFQVLEKLFKIFSESLVILATPKCELFQEQI